MQLQLKQALLRRWRSDDVPALVEAANNRNVSLTLRDGFPFPYTSAAAEAYIARVSDYDVPFCIEVEGRAAGGIGLHRATDVHRITAELGYWLAEPLWGRGIMTEAVRAVVRHGFTAFPLERIEAYAFSNNPASVRVLEKAGFTREGLLRRNVIKHGQVLDSLVFSILREEAGA